MPFKPINRRITRSAPNASQPKPRKQFAQHFLTDENIIRRIVHAADIQAGDLVLEVGPGRGHLSRALLTAGALLVAVEIDRELATAMKQTAGSDPSFSVFEGDFLSRSPADWLQKAGFASGDYKVVANLPYNITSAVLRHLLEASLQPTLLVLMLQREVALELTAKPERMSLLSVSVQYYGDARIISLVAAGSFFPRPKVDSALVKIQVQRPSRYPETDPRLFFKIVRAGFGGRRKQIHNALSGGLLKSSAEVINLLLDAGIDPSRRAETLSMEEWHQVYLHLSTILV